jgi:shikimate kinase
LKKCRKKQYSVFAEDGEDISGKIESEALKKLDNNDKFIVSTGGGAQCHR